MKNATLALFFFIGFAAFAGDVYAKCEFTGRDGGKGWTTANSFKLFKKLQNAKSYNDLAALNGAEYVELADDETYMHAFINDKSGNQCHVEFKESIKGQSGANLIVRECTTCYELED